MSVKKSVSRTTVSSYRIGIDEKKAIVKAHGTLSNFLNGCVQKEMERLGKAKTISRKK